MDSRGIVAVGLPDVTWVNKNREGTTEDLDFGRKANTHLLTRPDYVVFDDDVVM
jgi:hypothetical protein